MNERIPHSYTSRLCLIKFFSSILFSFFKIKILTNKLKHKILKIILTIILHLNSISKKKKKKNLLERNFKQS